MQQSERDAAYKTATALSVAPGRLGNFVVPANEMDYPSEHPHQYQGYGIASAPGGRVLTTDYGFVAVRVGIIKETSKGLSFEFEYICEAKGASYRMFPDVLRLKLSSANRLQTVNLGPDGHLWITRNSDGKIFVLEPDGAGYRFSHSVTVDPERFFLSAQLDIEHNSLFTVEGTLDCKQWFKCAYRIDFENELPTLTKVEEQASVPFLYGVGRRQGDDKLWYVTDSRCTELPHGIYRGDKLVIPGYTGGGLAFMEDGSCLVSYYGYEDGNPGAIYRFPASYLSAKER